MLEALNRRLAAVGVRTPTGRDALLGAALAVATVAAFLLVLRMIGGELGASFEPAVELATIPAWARVTACLVLAAQAMALTLRRRAPLLCLLLTLVGQLALVPLLPPLVSFQAPAGLVAAYSLGAYSRRPVALWGAAGVAVVQVLLGYVLAGARATEAEVSVASQLWGGLVSALVTYLGAALVGAYVGTRRELLAQLRERVTHAEREREALAARAVLEERGRIARELHDVAAHHLSGIVVQATAADRLLDREPERVRESLASIRAQGRETLENLRGVVGLLRGADTAEDAPQPTLADADELLDVARDSGSAVTVATAGTAWPLGPTAELTVYRVLQESLSNVRRHAPGAAIDVRHSYTADAYVVTVRNALSLRGTTASVESGGRGLVGMAERAALVGGDLEAGAGRDGAWTVRLTVPRAGTRTVPGVAP
ncbi:histidine kinase [Beutenbergia cavernae DSM 12333]|uniref:histidine kinase n=1 Tax=Beutenbergia cavernae (strain ATCC BAA-8 / DSM 12333 / CCUG 43141 / JCM 11478 / NBRC 16432 / NCIMB 13614 / HKI 0122) TaxID=471853 RepID=C5C4K8_BEUC1|nr:histidine kinase [Beutenbergia cavernae]ACQ82132.1 histidine kinase [Beutenbergia cavernae DSM 12333]